MPIEVMAERGIETLRHGPLKPFGLTNEHDPSNKPYAVIQLRQDNTLGTLWNIVGFQTKMTYEEQKRVFKTIPGLENANFARLGGLHRNTFINSFNVKGGRCEGCQGDGLIKIEMHFLPDIYVQCDQCKGKRYNRETLEILWRNKSISDVLEMTVSEGLNFFKAVPSIKDKLETMDRVGLGYIKIGQQATTLSGGEAQRIKLSKELSKRATGKTIYILDEPTTGLHFEDIRKLLEVLDQLVSYGNTVIVIEHNLDVIKTADWIIDLGPDGGDKGGEIVAEGTPEDLSKVEKSYTGKFLKKLL